MLKTLSKATSIGLIFIAPLIVVINRYNSEQTIETRTSLGLVPLLFIITISLVALWFFSNQFLEMVRTNKFGYLSIVFFGATLGTLLFLVWFVLQYIVLSAQANLEVFVDNFKYHQRTLIEMLVFIVTGLVVALVTRISTLKTSVK